ncbi:MAG: hypothetical protein M1819_000335 [Sarea resinae]|nr:MAG: hypothetical protein M1819_000335 [Sarea resinae]
MASRGFSGSIKSLKEVASMTGVAKDSLRHQCIAPHMSRTMATETRVPQGKAAQSSSTAHDRGSPIDLSPSVLTTIYNFPTMEPIRFEHYPSNHLFLPLRRDILHKAVVFEGDNTRQGTASTKWRGDIHGSGRKIRPQKGTGRARLGDRKSPMLRGGGVAFGPHPRDFGTDLPRKVYDLAWRTALSYRYRKGELIVVEDGAEIEYPKTRFVKQIFEKNHWGNADGRSLVVTQTPRKNLFAALHDAGEDGRVLEELDVDVKDLLELGRIIIEKSALDGILQDHQSDLVRSVPTAASL